MGKPKKRRMAITFRGIIMENDGKTKVVYKDVLGLGTAIGSLCALGIVVAIALSCSGQWEHFFNLFK